jgi:hypothetical protein
VTAEGHARELAARQSELIAARLLGLLLMVTPRRVSRSEPAARRQ